MLVFRLLHLVALNFAVLPTILTADDSSSEEEKQNVGGGIRQPKVHQPRQPIQTGSVSESVESDTVVLPPRPNIHVFNQQRGNSAGTLYNFLETLKTNNEFPANEHAKEQKVIDSEAEKPQTKHEFPTVETLTKGDLTIPKLNENKMPVPQTDDEDDLPDESQSTTAQTTNNDDKSAGKEADSSGQDETKTGIVGGDRQDTGGPTTGDDAGGDAEEDDNADDSADSTTPASQTCPPITGKTYPLITTTYCYTEYPRSSCHCAKAPPCVSFVFPEYVKKPDLPQIPVMLQTRSISHVIGARWHTSEGVWRTFPSWIVIAVNIVITLVMFR